ncbi:hypothetical protein MTR_4g037440 [Medicago truncatula]|uniref:Uncharacterized protein n=1 Tax=Medicago truncatula TaxID=3880 RepID=G7JSG8_MEDTR|nr:hypothetical protein MTR_4g037440 [Medicago truncatula]
MQVNVDPLKDVDAMYTEVASCNVVDAIVDAVEKLFVEAKDDVAQCHMVEVSRSPKDADEIISESLFHEKAKAAYPMAEEELIDFLNRCRLKNYEVMLCPRCSSVFDKEATKSLKKFIPESKKRGKWSADHRPTFYFINNSSTTNYVKKMVKEKLLGPMPRHMYINGFSRPIKMFSMGRTKW